MKSFLVLNTFIFFAEPCDNPMKFISNTDFSPASGFDYEDPSGRPHDDDEARPSTGGSGIKLEIEEGVESSVTYNIHQAYKPDEPVEAFKVKDYSFAHLETCMYQSVACDTAASEK